jgi:phosphoribosylaminoimidazole-succinocarboxamide synthase
MVKDRFRRDMGGVTEAYAEVARRLGIIRESSEETDNVIHFTGGSK